MSIFRCLDRTRTSAPVNISQHDIFYGEELLAPRPNPKLEYHPLSAVRDCLFSRFAATLHIGGRSSIRNLRTRHAVVTRTHLSWWSSLESKGKFAQKSSPSCCHLLLASYTIGYIIPYSTLQPSRICRATPIWRYTDL
jgi:hypothetical protein